MLSALGISCFAQNELETTSNEVPSKEYFTKYIYSDIGLTVGFTGGVQYEKLYTRKSGNTRSFVIGAGYDVMFFYGPYVNILGNYCIRKGANNLELGGGIHVLGAATDLILPLPDVHIAYKYQKAGKHLGFKGGLGFPKGINIGLGYAF